MTANGDECNRSPDWQTLADNVLRGHALTRGEARAVLNCDDSELLDLLHAAFRVRERHFGRQVQLYYLRNAKSGLCPEDCGYCSQSAVSDAPIPKYRWQDEETLLAGARQAREAQARTYCIVASGRGPNDREVEHVARAVRRIKDELGMHVCACLGLLEPHQARMLADAGVDRINHNLNTSRRYYEEICTTHTYQDRIDTLRVVSEAGMELCSGLIVGMGESEDDIVDVVMQLRPRVDRRELPARHRRHAAGSSPRPESTVLPEGAVPAAARASGDGDPDRRRTGSEPSLAAVARPVSGEFHVRQRLPDDERPGGVRGLRDDRGPGIRGGDRGARNARVTVTRLSRRSRRPGQF
jgi:biotin synthase